VTLERVLPDFRTRLALALLQRWVDPDAALAARRSVLVRFIASNASGNHPHCGPFVDALVDGLRQAARDACALHRHHVDFIELQPRRRPPSFAAISSGGIPQGSKACFRKAAFGGAPAAFPSIISRGAT